MTTAQHDAKVGNIIYPIELLQHTLSEFKTLKYQVLASTKNGLEIWKYEQFLACNVTMKELSSNTIELDKESAFNLSYEHYSMAKYYGALAGYLFKKKQAIKSSEADEFGVYKGR